MALSGAPDGENGAIWQVVSNAATGSRTDATNPPEVIYFNPASVATTGGYVYQTEFNIRNSVPENETVSGDNNEVQDMGLSGVDVQLTGWFDNSDGNTNVTKLMDWMKEPKTDTAGYVKGRFGLELEDFGEFNVTPTKTGNLVGYVIADVRFIRDGEDKDRVQFIINLRLSGDLANGLGT